MHEWTVCLMAIHPRGCAPTGGDLSPPVTGGVDCIPYSSRPGCLPRFMLVTPRQCTLQGVHGQGSGRVLAVHHLQCPSTPLASRDHHPAAPKIFHE